MSVQEEFKHRLEGTNIDPRSLLTTDYFNHFNEVIMLLNMLADAPELLNDIDLWTFKTYREHFLESGLGFADLAIEAYEVSPHETRERFEKVATQMSMLIVESRVRLRLLWEEQKMDELREMSMLNSMELQGMVDEGGSIVHGTSASMDQSAVDDLF